MKYLSIAQTAERWGISTRRIQILCGEGRVPGAIRIGIDDSSGDYRRGSVFLPDSESDFDQQYICTGDYYRTLCTIACVNGYDDPECGLIADRICNLRERIWGEDGIYEYLAANVSGGI